MGLLVLVCTFHLYFIDHHIWNTLYHGRAKVAHCVTGRWRNFSHYCRPICQYDVVFWAQRSTARCAVSTRCTQTRVYSARGKYIVRHWTSREASLCHSSGWGTWSVSPQYRDLRTRALYRLLSGSWSKILFTLIKLHRSFVERLCRLCRTETFVFNLKATF